MKKKTYLSVRVVLKSRRKITETDAKQKKNVHLHNPTLSSLQQTSTGLKLILMEQTFTLSELMRACKYVQHVS